MSNDTTRGNGLLAIATVGVVLLLGAVSYSLMEKNARLERAVAHLCAADREIAAGEKTVNGLLEMVVEIPPVGQPPLVLEFRQGQLYSEKIVDENMAHIPAFQRPDPLVYYDIVVDGARAFRGPFGPDSPEVLVSSMNAVTITVSRPQGPRRLFMVIRQRPGRGQY